MKKVFAVIALMGVFTLGMTQSMSAQDEEAVDTTAVEQVDSAATEEADSAAAPAEDGLHCDTANCVFCGLCARTCPMGALTVDRAEKKWEVDRDTCVSCGACVDKCPKKCLSL